MFFFGDIARLYYPMRLLYANALKEGRLPLWTPEMLTGFPLFAEMQTGVLYPPHLLLYRLLPIDLALNYDILSHLAWLGAGIFAFARVRGLSRAGAALAALALSAGGFGVARVTHPNVLDVASWLPWLLWLYERCQRARRMRDWALLVIVFTLQWLAGHPQFALINCLTFAAYALAATMGLTDDSACKDTSQQITPHHLSSIPALRFTNKFLTARVTQLLVFPLIALALGTAMAAPQLLPTYELTQASARSGGVTETFFTSFSFHPFYLALLVDPFLRGNPYPDLSVEFVVYVGLLPLLLAVGAVVWRRERIIYFWLFLAIACLLVAFGGYTPLYRILRHIPLLNYFRVPARFLFPFCFALAMLAGMGFDALLKRATATDDRLRVQFVGIFAAGLLASTIAFTAALDAATWLEVWRVLPFIFGGLALLLVLRAARRQYGRAFLVVSALGLTMLDLAAFGAVYAQTYNLTAPRAQVFARPRVFDSVPLGRADSTNAPGTSRILTNEWFYPWISVMRESLYPNLNAAYGIASPAGYTPLIPRRTEDFLAHLSPAMLNLLNVRYYLIPQKLPVDAATEGGDVNDPFNVSPFDAPLEFPATEATSLQVESSLAQSVNLRDGDVIAIFHLTTDDGRDLTASLRVGLDTAEWAYDRSDVRRAVQHSRPEIASTFPARSAFPIEAHEGHTYLATLTFSNKPVNVTRISVVPAARFPAGLIHVQDLALLDGDARVDVATLVGKANHSLVYRGEDVAVYENPSYAPRAFLTHSAFVATDEEALTRLQAPDYSGELLLADGEEFENNVGQDVNESVQIKVDEPEHVVLDVNAEFDAYVVLLDAWDPGWSAFVDDQPVPIHRADLIFRAVQVGGGQHRVEFQYRPRSFYVGIVVSAISVATLGIVVLAIWWAHFN